MLYDTPIDIYCAWDESVSSMNHYISFCTRESLDYFEKLYDINTVNSELFEELKRRDKWSVIDDTVYQPRIIIWNELSKEQQFKLLYQ